MSSRHPHPARGQPAISFATDSAPRTHRNRRGEPPQRQRLALELIGTLGAAGDLPSLLNLLVRQVATLTPCPAAAIHLLNRRTGRLELGAVHQPAKWNLDKFESLPQHRSDRTAPESAKLARAAGGLGYVWKRITLTTESEKIGELSVAAPAGRPLSAAKRGFLAMLSQPIALAIGNTQRHERLQQRLKKLDRIVLDHARAEKQLQRSRDDLRQLAQHLQAVRESERERIAREIHDELAQALTAIKFDLSWLHDQLVSEQTPVADRTRTTMALIDSTTDMVRRICTALRPPLFDNFGLTAAIQWQVREFESRTGILCKTNLPSEDIRLDRDRAMSIFRVLQEAITNVARHARASAISIDLRVESNTLKLEIVDNGVGIDGRAIYDVKSLGLLGMRERVLLLEGEFQIHGRKRQGTRIKIRVPISRGPN